MSAAAPPPLDPDAALMMRARDGDAQAFSQLLQRHHQRVLNLAWRYFGERAAAEDAAQEAFLKVWQARERYRPDAPFGAYLLRVASNVCLSVLRRRQTVSLDAPPEGAEGDGRGAAGRADPRVVAPGSELLDRELKDRVRAAVDRLPDRQRLAIILNKFEGLDYEQVAEHLGLSVPATKSLLHRARMALKDEIEPYLGGNP